MTLKELAWRVKFVILMKKRNKFDSLKTTWRWSKYWIANADSPQDAISMFYGLMKRKV